MKLTIVNATTIEIDGVVYKGAPPQDIDVGIVIRKEGEFRLYFDRVKKLWCIGELSDIEKVLKYSTIVFNDSTIGEEDPLFWYMLTSRVYITGIDDRNRLLVAEKWFVRKYNRAGVLFSEKPDHVQLDKESDCIVTYL